MQGDSESPAQRTRIKVTLIAGGKWHDIDFARLELLKILAEDDRVRVRVFEDYSNVEAISQSDALITYTCDVTPSLDEQHVLREYVESGGRWYALHGTNSILRFLADWRVDTPRLAPLFMETLGSMFLAHPPIQPFTVNVVKADHPLVRGISAFTVSDEQYLVETYGPLEVLLDTTFEGDTADFVHAKWPKQRHPVFYLNALGSGAVLYLTLGHCRGHFDMEPLDAYYAEVERCAWDSPIYYSLLRRGIDWMKKQACRVKAPDVSRIV